MLSIDEIDGITIIGFEPEYDALDEPAMDRTRRELLDAAEHRPPLMLCDFSRTKYFGSGFIDILSNASQQLRARGGKMVLCGLQPFCEKVLTAANLEELWDFVKSREAAIAALRQD
ncbi:MAG: STAS domain-containing protein [Planctomycetia bacterium]|nr:STAS domain-containing protein [Planctomycetia bacterium]